MNIRDLHPASLELRKDQIIHLQHGLGQRVESLQGTVWITIDNDRRDIIVASGEGFTIDRGGETLIHAVDAARIVLLDAVGEGRAA